MELEQWRRENRISDSAYDILMGNGGGVSDSSDEKNGMKISVLIASYNRACMLERLLKSIAMQNYPNTEVVIVDDASEDHTEEAVLRMRQQNPHISMIYLKNEENRGVSFSRKRAYHAASGEIIIFADDDDFYIEPTYFRMLDEIYTAHPDCIMTIAETIRHTEQDDRYDYQPLNTPECLTSKAYLNGFTGTYRKPNSVFAMSMRAETLKPIGFEELRCFNDTSLYLGALLGEGSVYSIRQAVGIYSVHPDNMTGTVQSGFTIGNLESKEELFRRACQAKLLDDPDEWHERNLSVTAMYQLVSNREVSEDDRNVWKWMKDHLDAGAYYRFVRSVMERRMRKGFPLHRMWLEP